MSTDASSPLPGKPSLDHLVPLAEGPDLRPWVQALLKAMPYTRATGISLLDLGPGQARLMLPARPEWSGHQARNLTHTGCLCALADTACGMAVDAALDRRTAIVTLDLRMDYLRSADASRDLECLARCRKVGRSVAFVQAELRHPGEGEPVAYASATFMLPAPGPRKPRSRDGLAGAHPALHPVPAEVLQAAARSTKPAVPKGRSPYVDYLGVVQLPLPGEGPIFRLPYREDLIGNPLVPALHGGVLAGFGETAMVLHMAATSRMPAGGFAKAVDFSMDYLRSARTVDTFAQAITVRQGNRVSLVQTIIWQDDPQKPVAVARGHCLMPQWIGLSGPRPAP